MLLDIFRQPFFQSKSPHRFSQTLSLTVPPTDAAPSPVEAARLAVEQFRATHPGAAKSDEVTVAMKAAILAGAGLDEAGRMAQKACDDAKSPPRGKVR